MYRIFGRTLDVVFRGGVEGDNNRMTLLNEETLQSNENKEKLSLARGEKRYQALNRKCCVSNSIYCIIWLPLIQAYILNPVSKMEGKCRSVTVTEVNKRC